MGADHLRASLLPQLSDSVVTLTDNSSPGTTGGTARTVDFYRVTTVAMDVRAGRVRSHYVELERRTVWVVAVDGDRHIAEVVAPSVDPIAAFNRLMTSLDVRIDTDERANHVFFLYANSAKGPDFYSTQVVLDTVGLQVAALSSLRKELSPEPAQRAFWSWWRSVRATAERVVRPWECVRLSTGYRVVYFAYEGGALVRHELTINANGTVARDEGTVVAPAAAK